MGKKCDCPPPGAPEWIVTYGDMMSLLLTFFILLAALSELKKDDEFKAVAREVQRYLGKTGGLGKFVSEHDPTASLIKRLEKISVTQPNSENQSNTNEKGIDGRDPMVTRVREGMLFTQGGMITFEPGSAELTAESKRQLRAVGELVRGYKNKIELRGHAASMEITDQTQESNLWLLSFLRAKAVMDYLVSDQVGVEPDRIRLVANADREPLAKRVYSEAGQEPNRRVEIVVMEALVEEFNKPEKH